jgi:hypothetical protein
MGLLSNGHDAGRFGNRSRSRGAQTAEASSTSVDLMMPMEVVRRRMTAPVSGLGGGIAV